MAIGTHPEAEEVLELPLQLLILEMKLLELTLEILVVVHQVLLLFVDYSHLVYQVFSCGSLVLLVLQPCQSLVGFEQLSFVLMHYYMVLLPSLLQLHVVAIDLLLKV